ncbi:MAG: metal-sensing transcriptional repressor [Acidimicrobiia bacterium]|nr:metal-sensing transcriptional repressor [Acidimicrobiia bacterium]
MASTDTAQQHVNGYTANKESHLRRLARIEGQVRGISRQVDNDTYCIDVLTQVSAVTAALRSLSLQLLDEHVRHCVAEALSGDDPDEIEEKLNEVTATIQRLIK